MFNANHKVDELINLGLEATPIGSKTLKPGYVGVCKKKNAKDTFMLILAEMYYAKEMAIQNEEIDKAKMSTGASLYTDFVYGNEANRHVFEGALREVVYKIIYKNWKNTEIGALNDMSIGLAKLIIVELEKDKGRCPVCKGVGTRIISDKKQKCYTCRGFGEKILTGNERARIVGISGEAWRKTWERRYSRFILSVVWNYHSEMMRVINQQLK